MKNNVFIGMIIVAIGIIIGGNELDIWDVNLFFNGWWTLCIIIPSIVSLFRKEFISGIIGILIGTVLLLSVNDIITWNMVWPIIIIAIGINIMLPIGLRSKKTKVDPIKKEYVAIFSGNESKIVGKLENTALIAIFGGVDLDLREANTEDEITINCTCLFGGIDIIAPPNVYFEVKGIPIFGGIENKTHSEGEKKVKVNCTCIFGGISIK